MFTSRQDLIFWPANFGDTLAIFNGPRSSFKYFEDTRAFPRITYFRAYFIEQGFLAGFLIAVSIVFYFYLDFDNCEMLAEDVARFYSNFYQSRCN